MLSLSPSSGWALKLTTSVADNGDGLNAFLPYSSFVHGKNIVCLKWKKFLYPIMFIMHSNMQCEMKRGLWNGMCEVCQFECKGCVHWIGYRNTAVESFIEFDYGHVADYCGWGFSWIASFYLDKFWDSVLKRPSVTPSKSCLLIVHESFHIWYFIISGLGTVSPKTLKCSWYIFNFSFFILVHVGQEVSTTRTVLM
jgi:hypothetical protein